jgi:hypothetical protein
MRTLPPSPRPPHPPGRIAPTLVVTYAPLVKPKSHGLGSGPALHQPLSGADLQPSRGRSSARSNAACSARSWSRASLRSAAARQSRVVRTRAKVKRASEQERTSVRGRLNEKLSVQGRREWLLLAVSKPPTDDDDDDDEEDDRLRPVRGRSFEPPPLLVRRRLLPPPPLRLPSTFCPDRRGLDLLRDRWTAGGGRSVVERNEAEGASSGESRRSTLGCVTCHLGVVRACMCTDGISYNEQASMYSAIELVEVEDGGGRRVSK